MGYPTVLVLVTVTEKFYSYRAKQTCNKTHCPGILSWASKTKKSMKMSTSSVKREHLYLWSPPRGFLCLCGLRNHQVVWSTNPAGTRHCDNVSFCLSFGRDVGQNQSNVVTTLSFRRRCSDQNLTLLQRRVFDVDFLTRY